MKSQRGGTRCPRVATVSSFCPPARKGKAAAVIASLPRSCKAQSPPLLRKQPIEGQARPGQGNPHTALCSSASCGNLSRGHRKGDFQCVLVPLFGKKGGNIYSGRDHVNPCTSEKELVDKHAPPSARKSQCARPQGMFSSLKQFRLQQT